MLRQVKFLLSAWILALCFLCPAQENKPKYIFLFIGDGMSVPQRMVAEEFSLKNGGTPLVINHLTRHATTRTRSADSLVTDSAASGTALACGVKTNNGMLGVSPDGTKLESSAAVAKRTGKKVGIVTSVPLNHATPAAFYAHRQSRGSYYGICRDLAASGFDFFAGGGLLQADGGSKKQPANAYELIAKSGYTVIQNDRDAFLKLRPGCGKVFFSAEPDEPGIIGYAIDRKDGEISLDELTAKGIELLDNPDGFFMMVEGGAIDWAGHSNDAAANLREVLEMDKAVQCAIRFAERRPGETLIVVTGDHETGGMTMGFAGTGYALHMDILAGQKCSWNVFAKKLSEAKKADPKFDFEKAQTLLHENFGFAFSSGESGIPLEKKEIAALKKAFDQNRLPAEARKLLDNKAGIGWTTGAHSALPVLTTSTGCGSEKFTGFIDNTDVARNIKSLLE